MRFLLPSMVRFIVAMGIVLTAIAVTLGRQQRSGSELRLLAAPRFHPISDHLFHDLEPGVRLLDARTGALERLRLPGTDRIEYAACSPWQDREGRGQLIGMWKEIDGHNVSSMGIGRYSLPDGEVLDRVVTDIVPGSPLCWYPGTSSRILFAGWDGQLYQFSFDKLDVGVGTLASEPAQPRPLGWHAALLNRSRILLTDPNWPSDPRFGGRLIVTVTFVEESAPERPRTRTQLWWLRLSDDGMNVVESGRLITPETSDADRPIVEERLASIGVSPDGDLVLAYLIRRAGDLSLQLRLGPVTIDKATGAPGVDESEVVDLAGGRASSPPVFSADGRWVYTIPRAIHAPSHAMRLSVAEALASRPGTLAHARVALSDFSPGPPATPWTYPRSLP